MKVLITGGAGLIGSAAAIHLLARGYDVRLIDIIRKPEGITAPYAICDITDFDAVREQMGGCDAVVHMAAFPSPFNAPGHDVFRVNTVGAFHIFEAAAREGVNRVVQASSINAIGCAWNVGDFIPQYFPVDEDHPRVTSDPYSFSKQQVEDMGDYFWRRDGISSIAFRFPAVLSAAYRESPQTRENYAQMRVFLEEFVALPAAEQERQLALVRDTVLPFRVARNLEYPYENWVVPQVDGVDPLLVKAYASDRFNLWIEMDVRDAALAVEKALTADFEGSHALFVGDRHNALNFDSQTLARTFFPEVTRWKQAVSGSDGLVSIQRAHDLIGFEPYHPFYEGK
jgi:nucleoside-diphosphate-sugar epimerase